MPAEFLEEMLELRMEIADLTPDSPDAVAMEKQLSRTPRCPARQVGEPSRRIDADAPG